MTELYITAFLKALILPPGGLLLLWMLGLILLRRHALLGRSLLWGGFILAYFVSTPLISGMLVQQLQSYDALDEQAIVQSPARAIVVLAAERYRNAPEYGGRDTVGNLTLARIRYAAYLHRRTGLPILVSGGHVFDPDGDSLAEVMADSLRRDFGIGGTWIEGRSRNTAENARFSQELLAARGIDHVLLVTHAIHMPRAVPAFEQAGLHVTPAPTRLARHDDFDFLQLLPTPGSLAGSYFALHELIGRAWYAVRY
jgi:uncharacterized SAM-binding protein YcdF (DUF218 family)